MNQRLRILVVIIITFLFLFINLLNVQSDYFPMLSSEPILSDNEDGNWTATWSLDNPDNYTLTNVEIIDSTATLLSNNIEIKEKMNEVFKNGSSENLIEISEDGIGIDLRKNAFTLISDKNNNRVIEVEFNKWHWQYGSNTSSGYGLNQLDQPSFAIYKSENRTLITDTNNNRVIEVGRKGEFYWQYGSNISSGTEDDRLDKPQSAIPISNNLTLIADTNNDRVIVGNRNKKNVWNFSKLNKPNYAEPLSNNVILITDTENHRVIEVDRDKNIIWQYGKTGKSGNAPGLLDTPRAAVKIGNGNILISDTNNQRIIEVNYSTHGIEWQYGKTDKKGFDENRLDEPSFAIELYNTNVLISDSGNHRIIEVNKNKNWKWQYGTNGTRGAKLYHLDTPYSCLQSYKNIVIGTFVSDVIDSSDITRWTEIYWNQTLKQDTEIQLYTRSGDSETPPAGSWSDWSTAYLNSYGENITSPVNRYIQYKAVLLTRNPFFTPILKNVTINGYRYEKTGKLTTEYFIPSGLVKWIELEWDKILNGQTIEPYYKIKDEDSWQKVVFNGDLTDVSNETGKIKFKFEFSTSNITITPILNSFSLIFERIGELDKIIINPSEVEIVVGEQFDFSADGFDKYDHEMVVTPIWTSTVGSIANGTLLARTTPGTGFINATANGVVGSAMITIIAGELDHISVIPSDVEVIAGEMQKFNAFGYDRFNNTISIEPTWETDVGEMEGNILKAQNFAGQGTVNAKANEIVGSTNVTVKLNSTTHHPPKILFQVPDQIKPEDSLPWTLNLRTFEYDDEDSGNELTWFINGVNENLCTVTGSYSVNDELTFIPIADAHGSDNATLWLKDSDNMTDVQTIWINITPVNDKPIFENVPDIMVHYGEPYKFDYSNYINDIDDPESELKLSVIEPVGQEYTSVSGLNITYNYPFSMMGKTEKLKLIITDGSGFAETSLKISVSDNHAPEFIKPFSVVEMYEKETKSDVFNLNDHFSDPDKDPLTYSSDAQFVKVAINEEGSVTISSPSTWFGSEIITLRATDIKNAMAEGYLKVIVLDINDPPQISKIPDIYVHYDFDYQFNLSSYVTDPDNDTTELMIWTSDFENISYSETNNMLLTLNYPEESMGMGITVILFVSDGLNITISEFIVRVTDNFPPMLSKNFNDIYFNEDEDLLDAFNLNDYFIDLDLDPLSFFFDLDDKTNVSIVINENDTVDIFSKENWFGTTSVTFQARDHTQAFVEAGIQIIVIPVNDAPMIWQIPDQHGKINERWVLDLTQYLSDVDNEITVLKIIIPPEHMEYATGTDQLLTINSKEPVNIEIDFIVTDGHLNSTGSFKLNIIKEKLAPSQKSSINIWILLLIIISFILGTMLVVFRKHRGSFKITDAFIIHKNGLLIKYNGKTLNQNLDEDLFSGMLTGVQSLISDSFGETIKKKNTGQLLSSLKMGDYEIMFQKGDYITVIVIYKGSPGRRLPKLLTGFVKSIEKRYGPKLKNWDGNYKSVQGIEKVIEPHLTIRQDSRNR